MPIACCMRAVLATVIMIALFFAGMVPAKAAIIIGGLLLLTRLVKSRRIYEEIDWSLLLMFAGLHHRGRRGTLAPHSRNHRPRKPASP
jgi:Na+/H+ antiporter NhaD/arsenite permease-like protein